MRRSKAMMRVRLPVRAGVSTLWAVLLAIALTGALPATAHEVNPAVADVTVEADRVIFEARVNAEAWIAGIDLSAVADTNDAPQARAYDSLRALSAFALEDRFRQAWPGIAAGLRWQAGGAALEPELESVATWEALDIGLPRETRFVVSAALPPDGSDVTLGWASRFGPLILRQMVEEGELAEGVEPYSGFLDGAATSPPLPRSGTAQLTGLQSFANYVWIGFLHILPKGLDHILFVLGVFFYALKARPLLFQVTAFTLAHTLTLALATLGIVSVPTSIVEPLIAASIAYIGVENLLHRRALARVRVAVVFGFGLLHGLGFASVLGDIGLSPGHFIASLVAFNIGVELGQIAVLTGAFLAVGLWFGQNPRYRALVANPASAAIAAMGLWWFLERTGVIG